MGIEMDKSKRKKAKEQLSKTVANSVNELCDDSDLPDILCESTLWKNSAPLKQLILKEISGAEKELQSLLNHEGTEEGHKLIRMLASNSEEEPSEILKRLADEFLLREEQKEVNASDDKPSTSGEFQYLQTDSVPLEKTLKLLAKDRNYNGHSDCCSCSPSTSYFSPSSLSNNERPTSERLERNPRRRRSRSSSRSRRHQPVKESLTINERNINEIAKVVTERLLVSGIIGKANPTANSAPSAKGPGDFPHEAEASINSDIKENRNIPKGKASNLSGGVKGDSIQRFDANETAEIPEYSASFESSSSPVTSANSQRRISNEGDQITIATQERVEPIGAEKEEESINQQSGEEEEQSTSGEKASVEVQNAFNAPNLVMTGPTVLSIPEIKSAIREIGTGTGVIADLGRTAPTIVSVISSEKITSDASTSPAMILEMKEKIVQTKCSGDGISSRGLENTGLERDKTNVRQTKAHSGISIACQVNELPEATRSKKPNSSDHSKPLMVSSLQQDEATLKRWETEPGKSTTREDAARLIQPPDSIQGMPEKLEKYSRTFSDFDDWSLGEIPSEFDYLITDDSHSVASLGSHELKNLDETEGKIVPKIFELRDEQERIFRPDETLEILSARGKERRESEENLSTLDEITELSNH